MQPLPPSASQDTKKALPRVTTSFRYAVPANHTELKTSHDDVDDDDDDVDDDGGVAALAARGEEGFAVSTFGTGALLIWPPPALCLMSLTGSSPAAAAAA
jgi:hypothetical protein